MVCTTALGFGAVHCVSSLSDLEYKQSSRSSAGAEKWLHVQVWQGGSTSAFTAIKAAGYQLVVTHLSPSSVAIQARADSVVQGCLHSAILE